MGNYVDRLLFKDNLIVSCAASGVMVMPVESNNAVRVHRSFGSIIDFNLGKNMLIIDNYEGNLTRVYELTRGLNINPKPYVTHSKKMLLEGITDLVTIESIALEERETHKEGG